MKNPVASLFRSVAELVGIPPVIRAARVSKRSV